MGEYEHKEGAGHEGHERSQVAAEGDQPQSVRIMLMIAGLSLVVAVAVLALWQMFTMATTAEVYDKELAPDNPELGELRARDQGRLSSYGVVDSGVGRYQIPIERAMTILVAHPELMARQLDAGATESGEQGQREGGP